MIDQLINHYQPIIHQPSTTMIQHDESPSLSSTMINQISYQPDSFGERPLVAPSPFKGPAAEGQPLPQLAVLQAQLIAF